MAQVVFRGDALYESTTYGYTPLGSLIVGWFMKLGFWLNFKTIASARIVGIFLFGLTSGAFFIAVRQIFKNKIAPHVACILLTGMGYLSILSGVNAEPKLWVLFLTIIGINTFHRENWLLTGLFLSLAAMVWQLSAISLFACLFLLPRRKEGLFTAFFKLSMGVVISTIPVLIYLQFTDGWINFWNQAILRRFIIETASLGESPLMWIYTAIYPKFISEIFHFILGFFGFLIIVSSWPRKKPIRYFSNIRTAKFLVIMSFIWAIFNTLEFQGAKDIFALLPAILIFATYSLMIVYEKYFQAKMSWLFYAALLGYCFFDSITYKIVYPYSEQKQLIKDLNTNQTNVFVIGFEEMYAILELPLPTRYVRYQPYEDFLINDFEPRGCRDIIDIIEDKECTMIIESHSTKSRSPYLQLLVNKLSWFRREPQILTSRGHCATMILDQFTTQNMSTRFTIPEENIPIMGLFYFNKDYSTYEISNNFTGQGY